MRADSATVSRLGGSWFESSQPITDEPHCAGAYRCLNGRGGDGTPIGCERTCEHAGPTTPARDLLSAMVKLHVVKRQDASQITIDRASPTLP